MQQRERSPSESLFWPVVWAVGLHVLMFGMLFVSFAFAPDLPPAKPIVQATLYQLKSQSQATTQTNQKIAGEAKKSAAPQYETEQLEQKKAEAAAQAKAEAQKQQAAKAAEQKKAEEAQKADAAKKAEADAAAKAAEQKKLADVAKAKAALEADKKKAAEAEAKKKAAEDAKKKAAEEAKKKAAAEAAKKKAAEDAKKKAAQAAERKASEDKKASVLAEELAADAQRQQAKADTQGDQTAGNYDDLIRIRAAEGWSRPPGANSSMRVVLQINMLPDGTITNVSIASSSGNGPFDSSAVAAVKNIGRLVEMQGLSAADFNPYRSFKMTFTPEDLAL
ncbi:cell envelope integrity protein TolA [Pseudomonas sp. URMO17WK12:I2]|uniref:cell envelope integrity protein TolA n=1 Tax=Pseudomonas sp. URMO17WK12:I2 TaxID=1261623 RepID=UPI000DAEBB30|nr:colicin import membrane protein [Pseudomonas sp. URMO17WK12:I2]